VKRVVKLPAWVRGDNGERRGMSNAKTDKRKLPLWDRVLGLLEEDLAERRERKVVVEVPGESDSSYRKEIGQLSVPELRSLDPVLREYIGERLLDRYLAEQGYVDLIERGRAYTKKIQELAPVDLPAFIEAERYAAEEVRKKREQEEFVQDVREDLGRLGVRREGRPIR
jgi:DNA-binding ferritin-like protein (Dps family)